MTRPTTCALVIAGAMLLGVHSASAGDETEADRPDFSGTWQLDPELSDNAREKMREAMKRNGGSGRSGGGGGGMGRGGGHGGMGGGGRGGMGGGGRGGMSGGGSRGDRQSGGATGSSLRAPNLLEIAHEADQITLTRDGTEGRALTTDGKKLKWQTEAGDKNEMKAKWDGQRLVVEAKRESGERKSKVKNTYEIGPAGTPLTVTTKISTRRTGDVTILRVYHRVEPDSDPVVDEESASEEIAE